MSILHAEVMSTLPIEEYANARTRNGGHQCRNVVVVRIHSGDLEVLVVVRGVQ